MQTILSNSFEINNTRIGIALGSYSFLLSKMLYYTHTHTSKCIDKKNTNIKQEKNIKIKLKTRRSIG